MTAQNLSNTGAKRSRKVSAMDPARLNRFLDSKVGGSSFASSYTSPILLDRPPSIYDPSISWDGLSVDPRPFSRFDARPTQIKADATAPIGLAGNRVIELDYINDGSVFGELASGSKIRAIPPTNEQLDSTHRVADGCDTVVLDQPSFSNYHLNIPKTAPAKTPEALLRGGPNADRCLLTPDERRSIMEFERKRIVSFRHQAAWLTSVVIGRKAE